MIFNTLFSFIHPLYPFLLSFVLRIKPRASHSLVKYSTAEHFSFSSLLIINLLLQVEVLIQSYSQERHKPTQKSGQYLNFYNKQDRYFLTSVRIENSHTPLMIRITLNLSTKALVTADYLEKAYNGEDWKKNKSKI